MMVSSAEKGPGHHTRIVGVTTFLAVALWIQSACGAPAGERTVQFPADASMGVLLVRDVGSTDTAAWKELGPAKGAVRVPANKELMLKVSKEASADLAPLKALKPDDLQGLDLSRTPTNDEKLAHIKGLTGLQILNLAQTEVTDAGLVHLKELKALRSLNLRRTLRTLRRLKLQETKISDEGLAHIAGLTSLEELRLSQADITNEGLKHLAGMKSLRLLDLSWGRKIRNDGLAHLKGLSTLETLDLANTSIDGNGLAHLQALKNLRTLYLNHARIGDAGLEHLAEIKSLETLSLASTRVTSGGLVHLRELPNLRWLSLRAVLLCGRTKDGRAKPSDPAIPGLKALTTLIYLDLASTNITEDRREEVQSALPKTKIRWKPPR